MAKLSYILLLLALSFQVMVADAQRYAVEIKYGPHDRNTLVVSYIPANIGKPIIVWFHGGGLVSGNAYIPKELDDTDYVIVSPNYRLLTTDSIDACISDAAAAVAWAFRNGENYGGDRAKVFVSGHSAGGYLTSMIGLDRHWLSAQSCDADSIAALVPFSGQAITHYEWRKMKGGSELIPAIDMFAPIHHIRNDCPPYIIVSGDRELELYGRYEENAYMWRMMKLIGHPDVELYELDGFNHGDMASPGFHILKNTVKRIIANRQEQ